MPRPDAFIPTILARFSKRNARGFDNAIVCDMLGNVAELATSNVFMAKDGVVFTPIANGTFLAGITRQRVIGLLREAGVKVVEKTLTYQDFETADEIFATGNYSKVVPVTRIGDSLAAIRTTLHQGSGTLLGVRAFMSAESRSRPSD